jgi:broad specificity phosphatase PhoE
VKQLIFITHPEVIVEPKVPVSRWHLSCAGLARMREFVDLDVVAKVSSVWASTEAKAIEAAGILAAKSGIGVSVAADLGENDRSSTGFLPSEEFEAVANDFFAMPHASIRGWERASDAQERVYQATTLIVAKHNIEGDIAIVAHGAVGTLLLSKLLNEPISRMRDQPFQGHYWIASLPDLVITTTWRPIGPRA